MAGYNNTKGDKNKQPERPVKDTKQPPLGNQSIRKTDPSHQSFEREESDREQGLKNEEENNE